MDDIQHILGPDADIEVFRLLRKKIDEEHRAQEGGSEGDGPEASRSPETSDALVGAFEMAVTRTPEVSNTKELVQAMAEESPRDASLFIEQLDESERSQLSVEELMPLLQYPAPEVRDRAFDLVSHIEGDEAREPAQERRPKRQRTL